MQPLLNNQKGLYLFLKNRLNIIPQDISFFELAFIPKSCSVVRKGQVLNNARLEFLGDAVFTNLVTEVLFTMFPDKKEGELSKIRTRIISRNAQEKIALSMGFPSFFEASSMPVPDEKHLNANTLEAFFGALFLDKGYRKTRRYFLHHVLGKHIDIDIILKQETDFKSLLSTWCQKNKKILTFHTVPQQQHREDLPFSSMVYLDNKIAGKGKGYTKKSAEQEAAKQAWKRSI